MKKITGVITLMIQAAAINAASYYGPSLCAYPDYQCIKVGSGQSWEKLFPDEQQRDIVQRLNRTYNSLWSGKILVVPRNLSQKTLLDFSPFPLSINEKGEKQVIVDQDKLAWGAYDRDGQLVKWGPISSGRDRCPDAARSCRTMTGIFRFFSKENEKCRSNVYPIGRGGAKMPFCMYFHKGFALHGSPDIPGYRASHGCVRMFTRDAEWLNHDFVELSNETNHYLGTKVVIRPVLTKEEPQQ
ncbi:MULTISPECIES: L,D-transpeptidase [Legionella]|uniref:Enhanced entry protein EnhA n=1 Tax=Legionella maceachernii TaxID=466 RepID=A0A0W0WFG5_9GAMM|nr:L,D-transpeptidase [Legionella maceachernii]KTD31092.1 enhanced entry protein EnhA [Legionella maceachernii]SJZ98601.1 L,D-transpeptidase catalytic domain [Legionella maceachernii]SUP01169.1 L,D-transpeptidase catalytic domain [Legionella maceachernii]